MKAIKIPGKLIRLGAGEVAEIRLISTAAGSIDLYHIVCSPNHLSVSIQGFKNAPCCCPIITLLEMYPKE